MEVYSSESYLPVDLDCLGFQPKAPFDLFLRTAADRFTLYVGKGIDLDGRIRLDCGIIARERLFIRREDVHDYYGSLKDHLFSLVNSPHVTPEKKAPEVHNATQDLMKRVFYDRVTRIIHEACDIICACAGLVSVDARATRLLVQLTEHDSATYIHCTNVGIFSMALASHFHKEIHLGPLEELAPAFFSTTWESTAFQPPFSTSPVPLTRGNALFEHHPRQGKEMLEQAGCLSPAGYVILLQHHERDDGSGYPDRLKGTDIHPLARICRMADIFEDLTADRPYHKGVNAFEALKLMKSEVFDLDRKLFSSFVRLFAEG